MSRRTRLAFEAENSGAHLADEVAKLIGAELGWGVKERKASVAEYLAIAAEDEAALTNLLNSAI